VSAGDADDLDALAKRRAIRLDLVVAHEAELARVQQQRRHAQRLGRRRRSAELAVHRDDCALAIPKPEAAVWVHDEMLLDLFLDECAWRERVGVETRGDRILGCGIRMVGAFTIGEVEPDVREDLNRGVEQRDTFEPIGIEHGELEDQAPSERVPDERSPTDARRIERLEDVVGVRREGPWRVPAGEAVAAEVGREHAKPSRQPFFREPAKPPPVGVDAVEADQGRPARVAPLVQVKLHLGGYCRSMLALLYDIHGSLPALDAVLQDAKAAGADAYLLGGDYGAWGPHPLECVERLRSLPQTTWIRGNGERWTREPPLDRPEVLEAVTGRASGYGTEEGWLYSLQAQVELDGVLYVHGSPLSDVESFPPEPGEDDERMLAGVEDKRVVFGHSHLQFRRPGPDGTELLNPGSVGMPLDGDVRAAYALRTDGGDFEFRRVEYDVERAASAYDALGDTFGAMAANRIRRGSD